MRMSGDELRTLAFFSEKDVAREEPSDGVCDGFAGAAVQIDAGIVVAGKQEGVVGSPQRRSENVRHTRFAATVASVALRHAYTDAHLIRRSGRGTGGLLNLGHSSWLQQVGNVDLGICRWPAKIVVVRKRRDVRRILNRRP